METPKEKLSICLISYRSNPHSGGQGVYLKNLARALTDLGHRVHVLSGPPDPQIHGDIPIQHIRGLDLYNPKDPFRIPTLQELAHPINLLEWIGVSTMGFPEPFTFGLRAYHFLRGSRGRFDVVHDNQSLSYGIWAGNKLIPTIATIHHPITVDRNLAVKSVSAFWKKLKHLRWHSFLRMQKIVSRTLSSIITVSECAKKDIARDFRIPRNRFRVVPNGINTHLFYPIPAIEREKNRLIVTNSADIPLKGLYHLLHSVARIAEKQPIKLVVIGSPKKNGGIENLIRTLGIGHLVHFTGRIDHDVFVRQYARASLAVVPSLYEGFGLPAGEAMACGVPVISTTGGALPEVVGDAGVLVPPGDHHALTAAILDVLADAGKAAALGRKGYRRIQEHFTWQKAAEKTVAAYREVIRDHRRF
ncbi:MAG: glycosyltransferase family 4 protein [Deltaproteobacteria bacterium]|nr:glycosyltransferase family 4 protein [Deltaproteobacteria bacterium]